MSRSRFKGISNNNFSRDDDNYPYLITGVINSSAIEYKISPDDFVSKLDATTICRHGAWVEHEASFGCKMVFKLINTSEVFYKKRKNNDVIDAEENSISFVIRRYGMKNIDGRLLVRGEARELETEISEPGIYQFVAMVTFQDLFTNSVRFKRGPLACELIIE